MIADCSLLLSRRAALLAGTATLLGVACGCGTERADPKAEQRLAALRDQARRAWSESEQALLLAGLDSGSAQALREAGEARRAHAQAIDAQLARIAPQPTTTASATAAPAGPTAPPPAPESFEQLKDSLVRSKQLAAELAKDSSGYQAGLAASVAASLGALVAVTLAEATL